MINRRWAVAGVAALAMLAALPACGSSGATSSAAGSCAWPTGSVAGYALALGHMSGVRGAGHSAQHDRLLAFDVTSGRAVGDCALTPGQLPQPAPITADVRFPNGPDSYPTAGLPVPTAEPRLVPDNAYRGAGVRGGVRTLSDGTVTMLSFTGWRVVATSGTTLLLTRDSGQSAPYRTAPADWCVLPSPGAARSRCTDIPGATTPGTGGIATDGTVHWTPVAATTGTVHGTVLTVGRAGDGAVTAAGEGSGGTARQLPTGLDQHSIVLLPGVSGPGTRAVLRWLSGPDPASSAATLHVTRADGEAVDQLSDAPFVATAVDGGARLVTISRSGQATEYTAGGPGRRLVRFRLPTGVLDVDALSWPSTHAGSGSGV